MPYKQLKGFKGVNEAVDKSLLSSEYATDLLNIDVDEVIGRMTVRKGYSKKYTESYSNLNSAYEFVIEETGDVILLFDDGGTLKYYKNGTYIASLSTEMAAIGLTGSPSSYFGWRNAIRMAMGTHDAGYMAWFGYTKRLTSENDGLFGNRLNDAGNYRLLRSQILSEGIFSNIASVVQIGTKYYVSFRNSHLIEIRDSNYQLIDRNGIPDFADGIYNPVTGSYVRLATDGTDLFAVVDNSITNVISFDPETWDLNNRVNISSGTGRAIDIAVNSTNVFVLKTDRIDKLLKSDLSGVSSTTTVSNGSCIEADDTAIYVGEDDVFDTGGGNPVVSRRTVGAIGTRSHFSSDLTSGSTGDDIVYDIALISTHLYVSVTDGDNYTGDIVSFQDTIWYLLKTDMTTAGTYTNTPEASVFIPDGSSDFNCISNGWGILTDINVLGIISPSLFGVSVSNSQGIIGVLDSGVFAYRASIVDIEGQEFVLSDPVYIRSDGSVRNSITISVVDNNIEQFYRIKSINLYRAFNSDTEETLTLSTNYKLLTSIDINSLSWEYNATYSIYSFFYSDNIAEAEISTVTYQENSGIGENVKPRYVNGKYMTWLDNQIHLANVSTDGDTYPNQIVSSPIGQPDNLAFFNIYKYQEDSGDAIKAISNMYGRTVVFKENRVGVFYNLNKEQEYFPGVSSEKGFTSHNDVIYYLNENGIYYLSGNTHKRINDPVKVTYDAINSYSDGNIFYFDNRDRLMISFPDEESFLLNTTLGTWTIYDDYHSFVSYFKNSDNEYIGFKEDPDDTLDYFFELFSTTKDNGRGVEVKYKSPLLSLENIDGFDSEIIQLQRRGKIDPTSGETFTIKMYTYVNDETKKLLHTLTISDTAGDEPAITTSFLNNLWSENITIEFEGSLVDELNISSFVLKYITLGETVE